MKLQNVKIFCGVEKTHHPVTCSRLPNLKLRRWWIWYESPLWHQSVKNARKITGQYDQSVLHQKEVRDKHIYSDLAVFCIHEGLCKPQENTLQVYHEAVSGHRGIIDLHSTTFHVESDCRGEISKHSFSWLGRCPDKGIEYLEQWWLTKKPMGINETRVERRSDYLQAFQSSTQTSVWRFNISPTTFFRIRKIWLSNWWLQYSSSSRLVQRESR